MMTDKRIGKLACVMPFTKANETYDFHVHAVGCLNARNRGIAARHKPVVLTAENLAEYDAAGFMFKICKCAR